MREGEIGWDIGRDNEGWHIGRVGILRDIDVGGVFVAREEGKGWEERGRGEGIMRHIVSISTLAQRRHAPSLHKQIEPGHAFRYSAHTPIYSAIPVYPSTVSAKHRYQI